MRLLNYMSADLFKLRQLPLFIPSILSKRAPPLILGVERTLTGRMWSPCAMAATASGFDACLAIRYLSGLGSVLRRDLSATDSMCSGGVLLEYVDQESKD